MLAALAATASVLRPIDLGAQRSLEYEVKAAFLYNFIQFIEWPAESLREAFSVCTLGDDPFAGALDRTVAGESVNGRPIVVEHLRPDALPAHCQILFVPRSQSARAAAVIRVLGAAPVLTVGESAGFLQAGGLVNLVVEAGKVRFDVNAEAATARGLRISSKLLRVARTTGESARQDP
jgi:hypothetical protein